MYDTSISISAKKKNEGVCEPGQCMHMRKHKKRNYFLLLVRVLVFASLCPMTMQAQAQGKWRYFFGRGQTNKIMYPVPL